MEGILIYGQLSFVVTGHADLNTILHFPLKSLYNVHMHIIVPGTEID